jgi:hypothetical protein
LDPDPERRFSSCTALVEALEEAADAAPASPTSRATPRPPTRARTPPDVRRPSPRWDREAAERAVNDLVAEALGGGEVREVRGVRFLVRPGRGLEHRCNARLPPGTAALKLEGFREQWGAEVESADGRRFVYFLRSAGGGWRSWLGRQSGLRVQIDAPPPEGGGLTEVVIEILPWRCAGDAAAKLLREAGPGVLDSVRTYLQPHPERRRHERLPVRRSVQVLSADGAAEEGVVGETKDVSPGGLGLYLPCRPPAGELFVRLAGADGDVLVPARVVRCRPLADGRFAVGLCFLFDE